MTLKRIEGPATEPISLAEAKVQCRIDSDITVDDGLIAMLIAAAREECEHLLQRSFITQTWQRTLDAFPSGGIELGMLPVQAVVRVAYVDAAGAAAELPSSAHVLDDASELEAWVLPAAGHAWPDTADTANAMQVTFATGYGPNATDVPQAIRTWILVRVATLYKFREELLAGLSVAELPRGHINGLIQRYRIWG